MQQAMRTRRSRSQSMLPLQSFAGKSTICLSVSAWKYLANNSSSPQTSDDLSSILASLHGTPTRTPIKTVSINTNDPSYLSIQSVLASLSSAREATITRVTPHVSTTLNPTTTQPFTKDSGPVTTPPATLVTAADGRVLQSQIGGSITVGNSIVVSTSKAAAAGGNGRQMFGQTGGWPGMVELGLSIGGVLLGVFGVV